MENLNSLQMYVRTTVTRTTKTSKRLLLVMSTVMLWLCAAKVISAFLISAVLVMSDCHPYTHICKQLSLYKIT